MRQPIRVKVRHDPPDPASGRGPYRSPITCQVDYTDEEREFLMALDRYRISQQRPFPTACEILGVLRSLGYRKVQAAGAPPRFHLQTH